VVADLRYVPYVDNQAFAVYFLAMETAMDWGSLPEEWWLKTAAAIGASERMARFCAAKHRGASNADAARVAGYGAGGGASARSEGYRLIRSNKAMQLLSMAVAEDGGGSDGTVGPEEAKTILSLLARGSDPNVKIKALESLNRLAESESTSTKEPSPEDNLRALVKMVRRERVPLFWGEAFLPRMGWHAPLLREMLPYLFTHHAEDWQVLRGGLIGESGQMTEDVARFERGPLLTLDQIMAKIDVAEPPKRARSAKDIAEEERGAAEPN
jgi:hypothetical protein